MIGTGFCSSLGTGSRPIRILTLPAKDKCNQDSDCPDHVQHDKVSFLAIHNLDIFIPGIEKSIRNPIDLVPFNWAIVTLTTVGYGDIYPITMGGRVFTFFILVIGLGTVAIPSGLFASALGKAREEIQG